MNKQRDPFSDESLEPVSYSIATGEIEWGKTLDSGELTIEDYLKRYDRKGIIWKDDGSCPLFDFSQGKIIEHIEKIKTYKKAKTYLYKLETIFEFILDKNGGSIPRFLNFILLASFIKQKFPSKSRSASHATEKLNEIIKDETEYRASSLANLTGRAVRTITGWIDFGKRGPKGTRVTLKARWDGAGNSWIILGKDFKEFIKQTSKTTE